MAVLNENPIAEASPCKRPRYHGWAQAEKEKPVSSANISFNSGLASINISEDALAETDDIAESEDDCKALIYTSANNLKVTIEEQSKSDRTAFKFSYSIPWKDLWDAQQALPSAKNSFWTYTMYKGLKGEGVKIEYCQTRARSEAVARSLLQEKVLGFDMEWAPRAKKGIKGNISLIQVACEDRVALFHIALHEGATVEQLLAPSLKKIIESPTIWKTGVAILNADGKRLKKFMGLKPRGFFELSHLFRLVKYSEKEPSKANKGLVALATQVHEQLGLPLSKGPVRCSDWTQPLSPEQIIYGASDAYAGFMLFHVMNNARKALKPTPPLPAFAELFLPIKLAEPEKADTTEEAGTKSAAGTGTVSVVAVVSKKPRGKENTPVSYPQLPSSKPEQNIETPSLPVFKVPPSLSLTLDASEKRLYSALSALSKRITYISKLPSHLVCSDDTLIELSQLQPKTNDDLRECRGGVLFAKVVAQHKVDLLAFIKKYNPEAAFQMQNADLNGTTRAPLMPLKNGVL